MVSVWALMVSAYLFGPIKYDQAVGRATWVYVGAAIGLFAIGCGRATDYRSAFVVLPAGRGRAQTIDRIVSLIAIVGLVGISALAIDKLLLSGLDYSQGATAVREARAAEVVAHTSRDLPRSPLLYFGYLTFPFSVPAYLMYVLRPELLRRRTKWLAGVSMLTPFAYAWLYGGRSPIAVALMFVGGAMAVRKLEGRAALPGRLTSRVFLVAMMAVFVLYASFIWAERSKFREIESYDDLVVRTETSYGAQTTDGLRDLGHGGPIARTVASDVLYIAFYLTHEIPMLDRSLEYEGRLGPYWGQYELYFPTVVLRQFAPSLSMDDRITTEGLDANIYGWFSTAAGGLFLDFGAAGGLAASLFLGCMSRRIYMRAASTDDLGAKLLLSYIIAGIAVSPVLSVFTISISLLVLGAILVTSWCLPRIAVGDPIASEGPQVPPEPLSAASGPSGRNSKPRVRGTSAR